MTREVPESRLLATALGYEGKLMQDVESIAVGISNCPKVASAFADPGHPCRKVATWQNQKFIGLENVTSPVGTKIHRPEAWTGDLRKAPIVVLASNPSFDPDEAFPDWSGNWSEDAIIQFATDRFGASERRPYGATDGPPLNQADCTFKMDGTRSDVVLYWRKIRRQIASILGKSPDSVSARDDFVMTELVHCKSQSEFGVPEALRTCTELWMNRIFEHSPAKLLIIMGKKPAVEFLQLFPQIPDTWGCWKDYKTGLQRGEWPKSKADLARRIAEGRWTAQDQLDHSVVLEIGGLDRTVIWMPRPLDVGHVSSIAVHPDLYDAHVLHHWRELAGEAR
jgi:hypothetical protein